MDSVNTRISGIQVSAVVLLIKWTSHAMFYKVKAEPSLRSIPMINVNTKNLNRVLWEMSQQANENMLRSQETDQMPE